MKIAFVYDAVYPWVKGGAEKRIHELSKRLVLRGNEVHLYGIKWWEGRSTLEQEGVYIHGICQPIQLYANGKRSIKEAILFSKNLFLPLQKEKFDVIDIGAFPYIPIFPTKMVSILKKTPMMVTWHEVWADYWYEYLGLIGYLGKKIEQTTAQLADRIIAVSQKTKTDLISLGIKKNKIDIIPNGLDLEAIQKVQAYKEVSDILFVGRLIKEKNVATLINAINIAKKEKPDITCKTIGEGPEKKYLTRQASRLGLTNNIQFLGFLEYEEIIAHMKSSKIFVLPSTREGFSMVVLEAMACGTPVITGNSKMNAATELIKNGENGLIIPLNPSELSIQIIKTIKDEKLRRAMAEKAKEHSKNYDWNKTTTQLLETYKRARA